jgi:hypothetical protein
VVAYVGADVLSSWTELGASTVVRIVDRPDMRATATRLVRRLGLSGFCGFDFVIENGTETAHLVEMNARSTPLTHLALGADRDLVASMAAILTDQAPLPRPSAAAGDMVSFFPQAWHQDPASEFLRSSFHDVPWEEPELVRELTMRPWPERGLLSRIARRLRGDGRRARALPELQMPNSRPQRQAPLLRPTIADPGTG